MREAQDCKVIEAAVRRWLVVIYAALNNNDWATADHFTHPEVRSFVIPQDLQSALVLAC